ncbi:hypothetical protein [Armatimonas rosea]|uniref:DUF4123 domain-containing protein n=1 Tax=Armatimonas rosea TaxID=685828 RepID=A0A7W9W5R3_ARMRO|nr:hypothetical protein [Armatimonas rosea]MBB6049321.1 hypothetical protein [Armatimonas rosea]
MDERLVALKDPTLPVVRIEEIWQGIRTLDGPIAGAILLHPNCSPTLFWELFLHHPALAASNPSFSLLLLESESLTHQSAWTLHHLLRRPDIPASVLELLTHAEARKVAQEARHHQAFAGEVVAGWEAELLQLLASELHRDRRLVWLARVGALPEALNAALPYPIRPTPLPPRSPRGIPPYEDWEPRWQYNARLGQLVLEDGLALPERDQRHAILTFFACSDGELAPFLALAQVAARRLLTNATVAPVWYKRLGAALNHHLPTSALPRLTDDGNRWVRAVAQKRLADPKWRLF